MHPVTIFRNLRARRRLLRRMGIRRTDLVLEVGSGQNPSSRADVLCDRYVLDDTERNRQAVVMDRPFVIGDIYRLPFRAGAFDFVVCSHVLEHLESPGRAAAELGRVAHRGYVEVPSRENEMLLSFPFHRWLIDREGDALVFRTKERPVPDPGLREWFSRLSETVPDFHDLFFRELHALGNVHGLVWEGAPLVRVEGPPGPVQAESSAPEREEEVRRLREALRSVPGPSLKRRALSMVLTMGLSPKRETPNLTALIACPGCGGHPLEQAPHAGSFRCPACGAAYPVVLAGRRGIPYLVS